jgi:metal-sulfur cluster biosynthetic enzyme
LTTSSQALSAALIGINNGSRFSLQSVVVCSAGGLGAPQGALHMNAEVDTGATVVPFPYDGDPALAEPIVAALRRVVDPEVALNIVDIGLIYGVTVMDAHVQVRMTMTSAACPVADLIVDEARTELADALPAHCSIDVELSYEPPWTPDEMSLRAKQLMGW